MALLRLILQRRVMNDDAQRAFIIVYKTPCLVHGGHLSVFAGKVNFAHGPRAITGNENGRVVYFTFFPAFECEVGVLRKLGVSAHKVRYGPLRLVRKVCGFTVGVGLNRTAPIW